MANVEEFKIGDFSLQVIDFVDNPDPIGESVEVVVKLKGDIEYSATICTLDYLYALMEENAQYNVFNNGQYLWGWDNNTVIIRGWERQIIIDAVNDMVQTDTIGHVFAKR